MKGYVITNGVATLLTLHEAERLIAISGTYGANGTEYRTEIESFSRIVSYGTRGTGPAWFKVWTKAGLIIEFGNTTDSAFDAWGRAEAMSWSVNKISDTVGNYITFTYFEDAANGVLRLDSIDYTGNAGAAVLPYASVRFSYSSRLDPVRGYVYGSPVSSLYRLDSISAYYGPTVVRTYALGYTLRANTNRSLLTSITETGSDGSSYAPLTFEYSNPPAGWDYLNQAQWAPPVPIAGYTNGVWPSQGTGFIDLNGDGLPDFVQYHTGNGFSNCHAWLNTPGGWVAADYLAPPFPLATDGVSDTGTRWADINGDGLLDAISASGQVYLTSGIGFARSTRWDLPSKPAGTDFVDLNGDGLVDAVLSDGTTFLNAGPGADQQSGAGWISAPQYAPPFDRTKGARFVDINGDGLPDQVQRWYGNGTTMQGVALNNGGGWTVLTPGSDDFNRYLPPALLNVGIAGNNNAPIGTELVDLNGDGLVDLIQRNDGQGNQANVAFLNTGHGWVAAPSYLSPFELTDINTPRGSAFIDIDNDGLVDVVNAWYTDRGVRLGTGTGWSGSVSTDLNLIRQLSQGNLPSTGADLVDLNGDGAVDEIWHWVEGDGSVVKNAVVNRRVNPDRLTRVINGFGVAAQLTYKPLTDPSAYSKPFDLTGIAAGEQSKVQNVIGPMYVVSAVSNDDGVGGQYTLNYAYSGLRVHRDHGSLGFAWMSVVDSRTLVASTTVFDQDYPFIGMPIDAYSKTNNGVGQTLSETVASYADKILNNGKTHFVYVASSATSSRELNGDLVSQSTTTSGVNDFDAYGNCLQLVVDTGDGYTKTTVSTYDNFVDNWFLGRLRRSTVTAVAPGDSQTRVSSFDYYVATGLLLSETIEPDRNADPANYTLTTSYVYDCFGNKTLATVLGGGLSSRTTTTSYNPADIGASGPNGRFPQKTTNAALHTETYAYDQNRGVATSLTGPNGLTTSWGYDGFGRKISETRADNTHSYTTYRGAGTGSHPGSKYLVETDSDGAPPAVAFYDSFGRSIASYGINGGGLDGSARIVGAWTAYDGYGRAYATSLPYFYGTAAAGWANVISYDLLNRPLQISTPNDDAAGGVAYGSVSYLGLATETTNPKGQIERVEKNRQGQVVRRINNKGAGPGSVEYGKVEYGYDAFGNLTTTTVYKENGATATTTVHYDVRGRKSDMIDPDMGTWTYHYDAAGELTSQIDAKIQTTWLGYDTLGRMTSRIEPGSPAPTPAITTTWTYDKDRNNNPTWKGLLDHVDGSSDRSKSYAEQYTYDSLGCRVR